MTLTYESHVTELLIMLVSGGVGDELGLLTGGGVLALSSLGMDRGRRP
jgi:hypothetical protein